MSADTVQQRNNGLPSSTPLSERYIEGWHEWHVHMLTRNATKYCALFYPAYPTEQRILNFTSNMNISPMNREQPEVSRRHQVGVTVLVNDVQMVDARKEHLSNRVASTAWLQPLEHCLNLWPHTFKHLPNTLGVPEGVDRLKDGKLGNALNRHTSTPLDNFPHQVIESGTEVMQRVTDDWAQLGRRFLQRPLQPIDFLAGITLNIGLDYFGMSLKEGIDRCAQAYQVSFTPLYLQPRAFEKRMHDLYLYHERQTQTGRSENTQRRGNTRPEEGRVPTQPKEGGEAPRRGITAYRRREQGLTGTSPDHHPDGCTARHTHSGNPEDV